MAIFLVFYGELKFADNQRAALRGHLKL